MSKIDFPRLLADVKAHKQFAAHRGVELLNALTDSITKYQPSDARVNIMNNYVEVKFPAISLPPAIGIDNGIQMPNQSEIVTLTYQELSMNDTDWFSHLLKKKSQPKAA